MSEQKDILNDLSRIANEMTSIADRMIPIGGLFAIDGRQLKDVAAAVKAWVEDFEDDIFS